MNEIFNYVNYVNEIILEPHEVKEVIILFLPVEKETNLDGETDFDFTEVSGPLSFYAYISDSEKVLSPPQSPFFTPSSLTSNQFGSESQEVNSGYFSDSETGRFIPRLKEDTEKVDYQVCLFVFKFHN